jgi:hypothetical protein
LPEHLLPSLRIIARQSPRRRLARTAGVAAASFAAVAVAAAVLVALGASGWFSRPAREPISIPAAPPDDGGLAGAPAQLPDLDLSHNDQLVAPAPELPDERLLPDARTPDEPWPLPPLVERVPYAATDERQGLPRRQEVFAADGSEQRLPELVRILPVEPRGMAPPRVRGYDLRFELARGDHPFVSPSADPRLAETLVPLSTSTAGYERVRQAIGRGRLPAPDEVRVEDFLAAMDYQLPGPSAGAMALRTAAGSASHDDSGPAVLQVAVRAKAGAASPQPPIVAVKTTLKVRFNARSVAMYRLVGHEATSLTSPTAADREVTLRADQTACGLFELWLKPEGGDDVAEAELTWSDPAGGNPQRIVQRISRVQFAKSFASSPLSLQAAIVAARTAEALRGSYFAAGRDALPRVLRLADDAHPRLSERESFAQIISLVRQAERLRRADANR